MSCIVAYYYTDQSFYYNNYYANNIAIDCIQSHCESLAFKYMGTFIEKTFMQAQLKLLLQNTYAEFPQFALIQMDTVTLGSFSALSVLFSSA